MSFRNLLLTSTSFQDLDGIHKFELGKLGLDIDYLRGPLKEEVLLDIIERYDALLCGDDDITEKVLEKGSNSRLRVISKYGSGLDKIDLLAAEKFGVKVSNCPAVNMISVSEHVFSLLLSFTKNIISTNSDLRSNQWYRPINMEIYGKNLGLLGLGSIGKEVAKRAKVFGLNVLAHDLVEDKSFCIENDVNFTKDIDAIFEFSDIVSIHLPLSKNTEDLINLNNIQKFREGVIIINTARSKIINRAALLEGLHSGKVGGYLADVFDNEPISFPEELLIFNNVLLTPHVASRTTENIVNQSLAAVANLKRMINENRHIR